MIDTTSPVVVRPQLWAVIVAVIIGGLFFIYGKNMDLRSSTNAPFLISVSAEDKISASPDIAVTSFGIQTGRRPSAKVAMELLTKSMTKVLAAVKDAGIEEKDITTESFWLSPVFDYVNGNQIPRGYEAHQTLSVKIRDLDKIGDVLSAATAAGANQSGGISFSIDNPDSLKAQARAKAIVKARAKAESLADELGMRIVKLTAFNEGYDSVRPPVPMMAKSMEFAVAEDSASLPVPTGQQDVTSSVTMTFELR